MWTAKELRLTSLDAAYHNQNLELLSAVPNSHSPVGLSVRWAECCAQESVSKRRAAVSRVGYPRSAEQLKPDRSTHSYRLAWRPERYKAESQVKAVFARLPTARFTFGSRRPAPQRRSPASRTDLHASAH